MALIQKDANADLITLAAKSNPIAFFATDQAAQDAYTNGEIPEGTIVFTEEDADVDAFPKVKNIMHLAPAQTDRPITKMQYWENDGNWYLEFGDRKVTEDTNTSFDVNLSSLFGDRTATYTGCQPIANYGGGTWSSSYVTFNATTKVLHIQIDTAFGGSTKSSTCDCIFYGAIS